jgi:hypothetical protein
MQQIILGAAAPEVGRVTISPSILGLSLEKIIVEVITITNTFMFMIKISASNSFITQFK